MYQLTNFGLDKKLLIENNKRYIDEDNDIYPPPLMTSSPSIKVEKFEKLLFPIWYLKINRVRQLLIDYYDETKEKDYTIFEKDSYNNNIISIITSPNHPSNISYDNNKELYDQMIFTVLKNIKHNDLKKLFNDIYESKTMWESKMIDNLMKNLKDRSHILIALWNYGLKYDSCNITKLNKFNNNEYEIGKRYYLLLDKCSLTLQTINKIAILTDGTCYEYEAIKKHLLTKNTNPLTNEKLCCESQSRKYIDDDGNCKGVEISTKTLYMPDTDTFEYFKLC